MNKIKILILCLLFGLMFLPLIATGYMSGKKDWKDGEVLFGTELDVEFLLVDTYFDTLNTAMKDSITAMRTVNISKAAHPDSFTAGWARTNVDSTKITNDGIGNEDLQVNSVSTTEIRTETIDSTDVKNSSLSVGDIANGGNGFLVKTAVKDSANNRINSIIRLPWTLAFIDSIGTNDSLYVQVTTLSSLGTSQSLFINNRAGVVEKVHLFLDYYLLNPIARLDSVRVSLWTETTNTTNYVAFSAWDDSTVDTFKSKLTATARDSTSTTARTAKTTGITGINITGGLVRFKGIVSTINDSTYVGPLELYLTNP